MLQDLKTQFGQSMSSVRQLLTTSIKRDERGNFKLGAEKNARKQALKESHHRLRQVRLALFTLLGQHPSSRRLMRNLALVENTLQVEGFKGFEALPVRIVAKALTELESVVWDWSPAGLAELRSRMAVLVKNRPRKSLGDALGANAPVDLPPPAESDFMSNARADVSEVDHAEFEEMERSWAGIMPTAVTDAMTAARAGSEPLAA